jgi:hypothetical protein
MRRRRYPPPRRAGLIRLRIDNRPLSAAAGGGDAHPWLGEDTFVGLHHERSGCRRGAALGRLSGSASEDSREGWVSVAPGPPVVQEPHSKRRENDVTVVRPPEGPALA